MTIRMWIRSLRARVREYVVEAAIDSTLRRHGMKPEAIPPMLRRSVREVGLSDAELTELLAGIRRIDDWPSAWQGVADSATAAGRYDVAWRSLCLAQRTFSRRTAEREDIYGAACDAYRRANPDVHEVRIDSNGEAVVAGLLDVPKDVMGDAPLLVLFTGLGVVAEELHDVASVAWARGWATLRIDSPGWGATTVRMRSETAMFARDALDELVRDPAAHVPGVDPSRIACAGTCIGGMFALLAATSGHVSYVTSVSAPWALDDLVHRWPRTVRSLIESAADEPWRDAACQLAAWSRRYRADRDPIGIPIEVHAAGRDRLTPIEDQRLLASEAGPDVRYVEHPREVHGCPGEIDAIVASALERAEAAWPARA